MVVKEVRLLSAVIKVINYVNESRGVESCTDFGVSGRDRWI